MIEKWFDSWNFGGGGGGLYMRGKIMLNGNVPHTARGISQAG